MCVFITFYCSAVHHHAAAAAAAPRAAGAMAPTPKVTGPQLTLRLQEVLGPARAQGTVTAHDQRNILEAGTTNQVPIVLHDESFGIPNFCF